MRIHSARQKIISIAVIGIVGFTVYLAITIFASRDIIRISEDIESKVGVDFVVIYQLESELLKHQHLMVDAADLEDSDLVKEANEIRIKINTSLDNITKGITGIDEYSHSLKTSFNNYHSSANDYVSLILRANTDHITTGIVIADMKKSLSNTHNNYAQLKTFINNVIHNRLGDLSTRSNNSQQIGLFIGACMLAFISIVGLIVTRSISKSLTLSLKMSARIADGDLSAQPIDCPDDEFGDLIGSLEVMRLHISTTQRKLEFSARFSESLRRGELTESIQESAHTLRELFNLLCVAIYSYDSKTGAATHLGLSTLFENDLNLHYFESMGIIQNCVERKQPTHIDLKPEHRRVLPLVISETEVNHISSYPIIHNDSVVGLVLCVNLGGLNKIDDPLICQNVSKLAPVLHERQKEIERTLLQNILEKNASDMVKLNAENTRISKAKSEFLACMSHEIRTPMNAILGMMTLVSKGELSERQKQQLVIAKNSGHALLVIINDILDFTKIEAGKLDLESQEFDLEEQLMLVADSLAPAAQEKDIEIITLFEPANLQWIKSDANRIKQIYTNLLNNAIKFTKQGEVVISTRIECLDEDNIIIHGAIKDTGIGIPQDALQDLFRAFTQVDSSTTRKYGGTGLGLAIASRLCNLLKGEIRVTSKEDEGSEFCFRLYAKKGSDIPQDEPINMRATRVLLIEPNKTLRNSIESLLGNLSIESVESFETIEHALTELKAGRVFTISTLLLAPPPQGDAQLSQLLSNISPKPNIIVMVPMSFNMSADSPSISYNTLITKPINAYKLSRALAPQQNTEARAVIEDKRDQILTPERKVKLGRILYVDDNEMNRILLADLLEDLGLEASQAKNGLEALAKLKADAGNPYKIVLMDCQMPIMNGYLATQKIRSGEAGETYQNIPIIALTANAMKGDIDKCKQAGMTDYMPKPIDFDLFEEKINHYLSQSQD